ncbi:late competence development ComFB family protein [Sporohalobacter salinus]|uniref:late competence development ComFB family protein n=1 Tax=Sporohalobacter salinus TaxID=1494606 RepID=UPI001961F0AD|nr:late competence development ComFB family protein [Sporohalobacter salinus]MBM7624975.1 competence protein ComFB [Sporohalobacter salinus]
MISGNLLEKVVKTEIEEVLIEKENVCDCEQCQRDILALTLSSLKPRYAGSKEGRVILESTDISSEQTKMDVVKEILKAVEKVKRTPHHNR